MEEQTEPKRTIVDVVVGHKRSGEAVYEEVLVDDLGDGRYRVVATPGLALGVAAGDEVEIVEGALAVLRHGGNISVQVYGPHEIADEIAADVASLGGRLDARAKGLTVFTIPVTVGFSGIEEIFNSLVARETAVGWYFGNVYGEDGTTPLGWWE